MSRHIVVELTRDRRTEFEVPDEYRIDFEPDSEYEHGWVIVYDETGSVVGTILNAESVSEPAKFSIPEPKKFSWIDAVADWVDVA